MNLDSFCNLTGDIKNRGGDYCDLYLQSSVAHSVRYEESRIAELSSIVTEGTGARIVLGGQSFYAHRPGVTADSAVSAVTAASDAASLMLNCKTDSTVLLEKQTVPPRTEIDFLHEIDKELRQRSPYIKQVSFRFSESDSDVLIIAPNGMCKNANRKYTTFMTQLVVERKGQLQTAGERCYMALPAADFWCVADAGKIAEAAFVRAILMLEAPHCPAGVMNVYLAGEAGGTIIHEACGHGLEADIVEKDASVFKGKLGQKVAAECVTMVDDPTIAGLYGNYAFDDEGTAASRTVLIENGILKGYLTDKLSAKLYNLPETGNGRRQSYKKLPIPRMSNTFLTPYQNRSEEEMLEITGNGLYVKKMGGGEVNPTTGDFVFYVSEAYLIKNGKKAEAVKGATIAGNGPEVLNNIVALGDKLVMDAGVCGKSGQSVPVTDGQPSMVIKGITVGGREA